MSRRLSFYESGDDFDPEADDQAPARSFSFSYIPYIPGNVSITEDHAEEEEEV